MTTFQKGDRVRYRSFVGDVYDATVTGVRKLKWTGELLVDLDIDMPGNREPFHTTGIKANRCEPAA